MIYHYYKVYTLDYKWCLNPNIRLTPLTISELCYIIYDINNNEICQAVRFMQDTNRNKTCCFIGHRKIKESEELKKFYSTINQKAERK